MPHQIQIPPQPRQPSRFLRRRARATIVDVFRRYVIPELPTPQPFGGYCYWIADSMFRRCDRRMRQIIDECGGFVPSPVQYRLLPPLPSPLPSPTTPSPVEDDSSAETTDTDGSSLHSPHESWIEPPVRVRADSGVTFPFYDHFSGPHTPSPHVQACYFPQSPQHDVFSKADPATEYAILHTTSMRYRAAACRAEAAERATMREQEMLLERLESKSRRRAWSSRALLGRALLADARINLPVYSSPLVWCKPVTPDMIEQAAQKLAVPSKYGALTLTRRLSVVLEGEKDVQASVPQDVRPDALDGDVDAEEGVIEIPVPQMRRHSRAYTEQNVLDVTPSVPAYSANPPAYFAQTMQPFPCFDYPYMDGDADADTDEPTSTPYRHHHLHHHPHPTEQLMRMKGPEASAIPIGMFDDEEDAEITVEGRFCDEFTLALDLRPYRDSDQGDDMECASKEGAYGNDGWYSGSVVECR